MPTVRVHEPVRVSGPSPFAGCSTRPSYQNAEVEPSLAAEGRSRLVAIYQQDRYSAGGGARGLVVALSQDAGRSWRRLVLPISRCAGPAAPQVDFASDPWVSVGPDGRIYVAGLTDVVSVATSADWGRSWSKPAVLRGSGLNDKESVTADPVRPGTAYVVWSDYRPTTPPGTESDELLSVTHDGGRSWSTPRALLRHGTRAGPEDGQILVDPRTGRLYLLMAWVRNGFASPRYPAWMLIERSNDGGEHWSQATRFATGYPARAGGPVIRSSPQVPSFAVDARGVLYGVWQDARFRRGAREDVVLTSSADGGLHWGRPRRIGARSGGRAILPTIAATGDGHLGVLYLRVEGRARPTGHYKIAVSANGGATFAEKPLGVPFPIREAPLLTASPLVPGGYFLGDYMGLAATGRASFGALFIVANRTHDDRTDAYYAAVAAPRQ